MLQPPAWWLGTVNGALVKIEGSSTGPASHKSQTRSVDTSIYAHSLYEPCVLQTNKFFSLSACDC